MLISGTSLRSRALAYFRHACQPPAVRIFSRAGLLLLLTGACMSAQAQSAPTPQTNLPTATLTAGIHVITAELADTSETRRTGLMFRTSLPRNGGMLFVFDETKKQCFWMRNTPLPLSIAFIADDGNIVNIADMTPYSEDIHCSAHPVRYALEMDQGWFETRKIEAGQRINGLPK